MEDEEPVPRGDDEPTAAPGEESAPPGGENNTADEPMKQEDGTPADGQPGGALVGSAAMRPVFLGNLNHGYMASDVTEIFERPIVGIAGPDGGDPSRPIPVDRVDLKRGYCFVFLKDATCQADKDRAEQFVSEINGMAVDKVSKALRSEFARGDGRIKRKEDDRRKRIRPSETLFVVNFHEETTKREDLQMLFEPYGELIRIEMKRNYAFVQFSSVDDARRAKEATNGGKLDQSVITVEYVARHMGEGGGRRRDDRDRFRDRGGPMGGGYGRGPPPEYGRGGGYRGGRMDDRYDGGGYRGGRDDRGGYDDRRGRDRSPPRDYRGRMDYDGGRGGGRGRSRSRSRSPPMYRHARSRSPPPRGRDYDDRDRDEYRGGGRGGSGGYESNYRDGGGRGRSSERDEYRGGRGRSGERESYRGDRDRGYRG